MFDLHEFLARLSQARPVFHSEKDFQHAFAWQFHTEVPLAKIRLERPAQSQNGLVHLDIWAKVEDVVFGFELKYKTRSIQLQTESEHFSLQDHGAQPQGRYAFIKDIRRLEEFCLSGSPIAWAIILTNDSAYWRGAQRSGTSEQFSLCENRKVGGTLSWGAETAEGTGGEKRPPIQLAGSYDFCWREYSSVNVKRYNSFRYLAVDVATNMRSLT